MSFRKILRISSLVAMFTLPCVFGTASATMLFSDDFDNDAGSSVMNFNNFFNWNVVNGTVDYLKGYSGISCLAGGCVDLDGSTSHAGRMISKQSFVLDSQTLYKLSVTFSGDQRIGYGSDDIRWGITNAAGVDWAYGSVSNIAWNAPFNTLPSQFTGIGGTFKLFVENSGGRDNVGPILDGFSFQSVQSSVPEPGALILVGLGIAALGLTRRRHGQVQ